MKRRKPRVVDSKFTDALAEVTQEYIDFLRQLDPDADPKVFSARHAAAKTALAHIEQLMKLSGASDDEAKAHLSQCLDLLGDVRQEIGADPGEAEDAAEPG